MTEVESNLLKKLTEILSVADVSLNHKVSEHDDYFLLYNNNMVPIAVWGNVHDMICGASNIFKTTLAQVRIFQQIEYDDGRPLLVRDHNFYMKLRDIIMLNGFEQLAQCSSPEEVLLKMCVIEDNV